MYSLKFTHHGIPVPWARPLNRKGGGRYNPERMEEAKKALAWSAKASGAYPTCGNVELWAAFFIPIPISWTNRKRRLADEGEIRPSARPDLSNYLKLLEDALNKVAYHDDAQVVQYGKVGKFYSVEPRTEVMLFEEPFV